ncbi:choice-of-anchor tandem repeat NxxGxxAF-containing protein [Lacipirellula parvula]|uniref:Uncharacterized protein n=1 Tax=Lacipirellula parvula TaxID=2650471 RepID=A0A5K7XGA5_9BACT|nr:choice-of-anchor tandem repeat NxxGxxAF-containing protein [Lacipirellula parvula]BBO35062.1 hypothetical protein PLANPX_4674 [Lacipirellula parvula]
MRYNLFSTTSSSTAPVWSRLSHIRLWLIPVIFAATLCATLGDLKAQPYKFTRIADTASGYQWPVTPAITNSGSVVFKAKMSDGNVGIFRSSGDGVETLVNGSGVFDDIGEFATNDSGHVVFTGRNASAYGVYKFVNGIVSLVADESEGMSLFRGVTINDSGEVAFVAQVANRFGIFTGPDVTTDRVAGDNGITLHPWYSFPEIDDDGSIVFCARRSQPSRTFGVFRASGDSVDLIAPMPGEANEDIAIGTDGSVLTLSKDELGIESILSHRAGVTQTIVDTSGEFWVLRSPQMNANGQIVFQASLDNHARGIFVGPNPTADKVILSGDSLFGGVVDYFQFGSGFNDAGQVAFAYVLTNGVSGIALATPVPEPCAAVHSAFLFMLIAWRRRAARPNLR